MFYIPRYAASTGRSVLETSFGEGQQITGAACDLTGDQVTSGSLRCISGLALTCGDRAVSGQASSRLDCGHYREGHPVASASALPVHVQGWFPLGLTARSSLRSQEALQSPLQHHHTRASVLRLSFLPISQARFLHQTFPSWKILWTWNPHLT